jgi:hypothetical protein
MNSDNIKKRMVRFTGDIGVENFINNKAKRAEGKS